jgi:SAM-dependent methyltransferase
MKTTDAAYAQRLDDAGGVWWKRVLDVQRPYRAHLRSLRLGRVLEIGCGVGRNLGHLRDEHAVGVDHNPHAVAVACSRGLRACTPEQFRSSPWAAAGAFESLLVSHVLEHMTSHEASALLREWLGHLRTGGRCVVITPQEAGFRSDPTHVEFVDFARAAEIVRDAGLEPLRQYSFPFPRFLGRVFKYNEFVTLARKP